MNAPALLLELHAAGVRIQYRDGKLFLGGKVSELSPAQLDQAKRLKLELMKLATGLVSSKPSLISVISAHREQDSGDFLEAFIEVTGCDFTTSSLSLLDLYLYEAYLRSQARRASQ